MSLSGSVATRPPAARARTAPAQAGQLAATAAGLGLAVLLSLAAGSRALGPGELLDVVRGSGSLEARAIVLDLRLSRTVAAVIAGAGLAVAGAVIQGHTRNPLADPGLLGVTSGAAVAVVLAIFLLGITDPAGYLWFCLLGAFTGTVLVAAVGLAGARRRDASPASLVLAGAAVNALLGAITGVMLLLDSATLDVYRFWTVGSLAGAPGPEVLTVAGPLVLAGIVLALVHAPALDALALGDDAAKALGRNPLHTRLIGLAAVTLLVGGAVAGAGSLGFVGLLAPHVVRHLTGPAHRWLLPQCALVGAILVLLADVAGRLVVHPAELPVGVVLGVFGAPAFVVIVLRLRANGGRR
ncbi:iron ABC transporter permease [Kineosporia sp. NBRC 101731]|uniref:FecCD family ABC transporter permease n=1 Tax=Kineosporia sp. NBRC 101731 TaxID=3032199 RepID=UPI0024A51DEE|nr:iron ABC transporter permease [Kineosporia sp. NBRC 101731]GLY31616.1 iron ABC transporter permease [Kineosporia sp. NBRC 101731]